jgi:hypothetical protein
MKSIKAIAISKKASLQLVLQMIFIFFPLVCMAGPGFEGEQQEVPVDGGLSLLVAAGAAYGARKLRRNRTTL